MRTEDQSDVIAFLAAPATHGGAAVSVIETHASMVFLAGSRAFKLKRAVRYDYLDFSTAERRRAMCDAELRINRRTAPQLYLGVSAITRGPDGLLALAGGGSPVDWVLEMVRFDEDAVLDRLAAKGALDLGLMRPLGAEIARFHLAAEARADHGGAAGMRWVIDGNASGYATDAAGILDPAVCGKMTAAARIELRRRADLLDARRQGGFVRQCHGDLHLRNIVLLDHHPTLFDGIEFNDDIACGDAFYDLAFLLMDLWRRRLQRHANTVLNSYLSVTADVAGLTLLPLFLSCRAAVRAKTSATAATLQRDPQQQRALGALAREYLDMAGSFLHPPEATVIAIGGHSGSGKTTLAYALAPEVLPVPGAVVVRSDEIRKALAGVSPFTRLGPAGYTLDMTSRVYATLMEHLRQVARTGQSVIVDAVFGTAADRGAVERAAHRAGCAFRGVWLDAPEPTLIARVNSRSHDASDADADVVQQQVARPTGAIAWHRIDASQPLEEVARRARAAIEPGTCDAYSH
jgi:aminoglycoside phosphotransferase family enzyme/predicted kinase